MVTVRRDTVSIGSLRFIMEPTTVQAFPRGSMRMDPMKKNRLTELSDEDKIHISQVFSEIITPKLKRLQARLGTLSCAFAGEEYTSWAVQFRSVGDDFKIVDFEYDEDAEHLDLEP
jgi:hypothetical protein